MSETLTPILGHCSEATQRVYLTDPSTIEHDKRSPCETQAALLGTYVTSRGVFSEVSYFNRVFVDYDLDLQEALGYLDIGLKRLQDFADPNVEAFEHVGVSIENVVTDRKKDNETEFLAGIQVLFDTELGDIRPELIYARETFEEFMPFMPHTSLLSLYQNQIPVEREDLEGNDVAIALLNPNVLTRAKLAITAASMVLPKALDELI